MINTVYTNNPLQYLEDSLSKDRNVIYYDHCLGWFDFRKTVEAGTFYSYKSKPLDSMFQQFWKFPVAVKADHEVVNIIFNLKKIPDESSYVDYVLQFTQIDNVNITYLLPEDTTQTLATVKTENALTPTNPKVTVLYNEMAALKEHEDLSINSILFVGFPGTGKTESAKYLAKFLQVPMYQLKLDQVFNSLVGETEKAIAEALDFVSNRDCVFFIDEFDKLFASSNNTSNDVVRRVKSILLQWMTERKKCVLVLAANRVAEIPSELLRKGRIDKVVYTPIPSEEEIGQILTKFKVLQKDLGDLTGYTHAEVAALAKEYLRLKVIREKIPNYSRQLVLPKPLIYVRQQDYKEIEEWALQHES